jgi:hypothetical protein
MSRVYADLPWRILVTNLVTRTLTVLDHRATDRQFAFVLNGPASHTGQVATDDPEINIAFPNTDSPALLSNNTRLIYALRREPAAWPPYVCRFGGIVMNVEDTGADSPTGRYTAYDPWQYMFNRPVRDPDTLDLPGENGVTYNAGTRASDIAVEQLILTEGVDGETHIELGGTTLPLVEDTAPLAEPITFEAGLSVGEAWQQLCETGTIDITLPPLYDPDAYPGKVCMFQCSPKAGTVRHDMVMAWDQPGHSLMELSRMIDGTRLANRVQFFIRNRPITLQSDAASISAYGEYWAQQFFPDANNRGELVLLAALAQLVLRRNGAKTINASPAPERSEIPLRDYTIGDYLPFWATRNFREPMSIDYDAYDPDFPGAAGYQRVQMLPIDVDDNGTTIVRGLVTQNETDGGVI